MADFAFAQVVFVAAVVAILAQCSVYFVRHWRGMSAARRLLVGSLGAFLLVTAGALVWGLANGDLPKAFERFGARPFIDFVLFIGFTMFISYFMGSRYLADELERAKARESAASEGIEE